MTEDETVELEAVQPVGTFLVFGATSILEGIVYLKVSESSWQPVGDYPMTKYTRAAVSQWIRTSDLGVWSFS